MKKETIITAMVFLVVGFFAGYIAEAEFNWNAPEKMSAAGAVAAASNSPAQPAGDSASSDSAGAAMGASGAPPGANGDLKLPPGHPPLDAAATVRALEDQAAKNPQDPTPALELADFYYDQQQFDHAAEWYEKALALDPKNVNARTDLGTSYFNLGRSQDALKEYQESLKIDPNHEPTMFNMVIVNLMGTHDLAAARVEWNKLHQRNPAYPGLDGLKKNLDAAGGNGAASGATR